MARLSPDDSFRSRPGDSSRGGTLLKATSFALIGVLNTAVDYGVFLLARAVLSHSAGALALFAGVASSCRCGSANALLLIASNLISWTVAMTGSYMMNSRITFAAESGRRLHWRAYLLFAASGIVGLIANTATLLLAAQFFALPIWIAKALSILASFVTNFSMSHFVVFRTPREN
jgi:putative flippase GtrA